MKAKSKILMFSMTIKICCDDFNSNGDNADDGNVDDGNTEGDNIDGDMGSSKNNSKKDPQMR